MMAQFRRNHFYRASAFLLVLVCLHPLIVVAEPHVYRITSDNDDSPPPYVNKRSAARVPVDVLDQLVGHYVGPRSGDIHIQRDGNTLVVEIGKFNWLLYPKSDSFFFMKDRDFTVQFVRNARHQVTKMISREHGKIVETARVSR